MDAVYVALAVVVYAAVIIALLLLIIPHSPAVHHPIPARNTIVSGLGDRSQGDELDAPPNAMPAIKRIQIGRAHV